MKLNKLFLAAGVCAALAGGTGALVARNAEAPQGAARTPAHDDGNTAVRWNTVARELTAGQGHGHGHGGIPILGGRPLALLSVAQLAAIETLPRGASMRVAIAAASATVLAHDHAPRASEFEAKLDQEKSAARSAGETGEAIAAGERTGRSVAEQLLAKRATDGHTEPGPFTPLTGDGYWRSAHAADPIGTHWGKVRPWLLESAEQFRPMAPPAVGSAEFQAALAEVKATTASLTPEQKQLAQKWMNPVDGYWNEVAADLIARDELSDEVGARVLTLMNVSIMDAAITCFEAKYHYQYPRPSHMDTTIAMAVMLPNHPSYVSGHSCVTGAAASVLEHYFPSDAATIRATAEEIAQSRLYAGVHYRFDNETGLQVGRAVGERALEVQPTAAQLISR